MTDGEFNAAGRPPGADLDAVLRDYLRVTQRLQETHERLQGEIARLRCELASKDRELEVRRRLAALGELAAGLAHEVRNPLGAIQLYSSLLRKECGRLGPALQLIDKIEMGVHAIDGVVQDTLALAPRRGRCAAHRLADILEAAHDNCRQTLADRGVRLRMELADQELCVRVEPDGLQRVFINLLVNGAEASPAGAEMTVAAEALGEGAVRVRVQDRGRGLADEVLGQLFDPFFTTKEHGTGLGLTIALRLVEAYGGTLGARNRPGGGAEFTLVLPAAGSGELDDSAAESARRSGAA